MALKNLSILTGATIAATGGSAKSFVDDGVSVPNGVHIVCPATVDARVRENATFKFRPAALQSDGTYSRRKDSISYTIPQVLASGKIVNNTVRIERDIHPELPAASAADLNKQAAQLLVDTDCDNFWAVGSLS